ncbi:uncharacterized protein N7511_005736 [Penicillium nucicola]|uniref:uncharacterized protein n=1 Tax=Penicillium nucicola TaxID=1850975 RepID=UPI002544DED1|nr:uncharacterized protein N7511_005736 [Penicillium nucicola]KAJ5762354.1 hypothetical protein N7511_005736 [Penicillium nucicola]
MVRGPQEIPEEVNLHGQTKEYPMAKPDEGRNCGRQYLRTTGSSGMGMRRGNGSSQKTQGYDGISPHCRGDKSLQVTVPSHLSPDQVPVKEDGMPQVKDWICGGVCLRGVPCRRHSRR